MERSQLFDLMGELKLYGMKTAFDEIMATAVKRQHEPQRIVGDLLNTEIDEKQARSDQVPASALLCYAMMSLLVLGVTVVTPQSLRRNRVDRGGSTSVKVIGSHRAF